MKKREQDRVSPADLRVGPAVHAEAQSNEQREASPNRSRNLQQTVGNQGLMRLLRSGAIHANLQVSQPGDADELEADRMAEGAVSPTIHRKCACEGGASCPACEEETVEEAKGIHRKTNRPSKADESVGDDLVQSLGPGQPLEPQVRTDMESRLGYDFNHVRVHTDETSAESARSISARAYTFDRDIVFDRGAYAPDSTDGRRLIAHELSHVVQQGGGRTASAQGGPGLSPAGPRKVQRQFNILNPGQTVADMAARWLLNPINRQFADDLMASVKEAPEHAGEILVGEVWDAIKEHWVSFLAVTIGMITAETVIGILTGIPEPTLLTKVVAVILQLLVAAIIGYFAGVELAGVYEEGRNWFALAKEAKGDAKKITEASRSFLRMIRHIILAILAVAGARAKIRGGLRIPGAGAAGKVPPVGEPPVGKPPVAEPPVGTKAPPTEPSPPVAESKPPVSEGKGPAVEEKAPTVEEKAPAAAPHDLENAARDAAGRATTAPAEGQLSEAGRSLSKHARGQRAGSKGFPEIKGGPAEINAQASKVLDGILKDPDKIVKVRPGAGGKQILQVSRADGTGAIFKMENGQWTFSHFAENLY